MKSVSRRSSRPKRSLEPVAWAALPVLALGVGVLASGVGIDLLAVALVILFLLTVDRTVGDWMAETVGPTPAAIVFSLAVGGCTWYFFSNSSNDFFAAAEERGYRTAYYHRGPAAPDLSPEAGSAVGRGPVQSAVTPSAGAGREPNPSGVPAKDTPEAEEPRAKSESATNGPREGAETRSTEGPSSPASPPGPSVIASAARIVFGNPSRPPAPAPSRITLTLSPAQVPSARRTTFQVLVTAEGRGVTEGAVDFTVNGAGVGKVALDWRGVATTTFATHITGIYDVRARFLGTPRFEPASSEVHTLHVIR